MTNKIKFILPVIIAATIFSCAQISFAQQTTDTTNQEAGSSASAGSEAPSEAVIAEFEKKAAEASRNTQEEIPTTSNPSGNVGLPESTDTLEGEVAILEYAVMGIFAWLIVITILLLKKRN